MDESKQPGLQIDQVFLLQAQFAHRQDVLALPPNTSIGDLPITVETKALGKPGDRSIAISLRAFTPEGQTPLYRIDIEVAAIISAIPGQENLDPFEYAMKMGSAAFFPFLREAVATITLKGRFGPVWLKPINFAALAAAQPAPPQESLPSAPQNEG
jgi:preprotein translocase subunit SecB